MGKGSRSLEVLRNTGYIKNCSLNVGYYSKRKTPSGRGYHMSAHTRVNDQKFHARIHHSQLGQHPRTQIFAHREEKMKPATANMPSIPTPTDQPRATTPSQQSNKPPPTTSFLSRKQDSNSWRNGLITTLTDHYFPPSNNYNTPY